MSMSASFSQFSLAPLLDRVITTYSRGKVK